MIRAGIVGLGRWGRSLVASVAGTSDCIQIVCAATRRRAAAEEFCRRNALTLVASYDEMLRRPDLDAVIVATPHTLHEPQALAAIGAGKHVFVEKPLTLDLPSARRVAARAGEAGLVLAVGFNRRFHPAVAALRDRVRSGQLGSLVALTGQHTTSTAQFIAPDNWRAAAEEAPGGAFSAVGVHVLDHMIELAGRVRSVYAVTGRHYPGTSDDTTTVLLHFAGGATGTIFCSVATPTNYQFTVYGTEGLGEILRPDLSRLRFSLAAKSAPSGIIAAAPDELVEFPGFDTLQAELAAFARAVEQQNPYPVPIDEVLHGMAVFDAVVRSSRSDTVVPVAD